MNKSFDNTEDESRVANRHGSTQVTLPREWHALAFRGTSPPAEVLRSLGYVALPLHPAVPDTVALLFVGANMANRLLELSESVSSVALPAVELPESHPAPPAVLPSCLVMPSRVSRATIIAFLNGTLLPSPAATFPLPSADPLDQFLASVESDAEESGPSLTTVAPGKTLPGPVLAEDPPAAPLSLRPRLSPAPHDFEQAECALTFTGADGAYLSLLAVNPEFIHLKMDIPAPLDVGESDPVVFSDAWKSFAASLTQYCYFQKSVCEAAIAGNMALAERCALIAANAALGRHSSTSAWARQHANSLPDLLASTFATFIFPRVGPQCAFRLRSFKEDRTVPLQLVHERFLGLASMARDVTVREARQRFLHGVASDESSAMLTQWTINETIAHRHVSLAALVARHFEIANTVDPERTQPATVARAPAAVRSIAQSAHPSIIKCWGCNQDGHMRRDCPFREQGAPSTGGESIEGTAPALTFARGRPAPKRSARRGGRR